MYKSPALCENASRIIMTISHRYCIIIVYRIKPSIENKTLIFVQRYIYTNTVIVYIPTYSIMSIIAYRSKGKNIFIFYVSKNKTAM